MQEMQILECILKNMNGRLRFLPPTVKEMIGQANTQNRLLQRIYHIVWQILLTKVTNTKMITYQAYTDV